MILILEIVGGGINLVSQINSLEELTKKKNSLEKDSKNTLTCQNEFYDSKITFFPSFSYYNTVKHLINFPSSKSDKGEKYYH
jgi:hypothetical protein